MEAPGTADVLLRQDEWLVSLASRRTGIRRSVSVGGSAGARSGVDFRGVTDVVRACAGLNPSLVLSPAISVMVSWTVRWAVQLLYAMLPSGV